jgi:hypothetical protein
MFIVRIIEDREPVFTGLCVGWWFIGIMEFKEMPPQKDGE